MNVAPEVEPGVEGEFERWLETRHERCFGWAMVCCRWNRADAMDTLQTAYVRVLEGRAKMNGCPDRTAFLLGVIRRIALEQRRHRALRLMGLLRWQRLKPEASGPTRPDVATEKSESRRRVRQLLSRVSKRQRELLHLVFYQEMTIDEAAVVLGISQGAARTHYERGKARLRRLLEEGKGTTP